jgi:hypothetical protein
MYFPYPPDIYYVRINDPAFTASLVGSLFLGQGNTKIAGGLQLFNWLAGPKIPRAQTGGRINKNKRQTKRKRPGNLNLKN